MNIGDRHGDALGGRLRNAEGVEALSVCVSVEAGANSAAVQHTVAMACNLLSRLKNVVKSVSVAVAEHATLRDGIIPEACVGRPLKVELERYIERIGVAEAPPEGCDITVYVGPGDTLGPRAIGLAWTGGVTHSGHPTSLGDSTLPFGPYLAACFLAAEVFRIIMVPDYKPGEAAFYDSWSLTPTDAFEETGPRDLAPLALAPITLVGVGAVGVAWLQTMWAIPALELACVACDGDDAGIEDTNLNRYSIFGVEHIGQKKASAAIHLLRRPGFHLQPRDVPFETLDDETISDVVICAVDTNESRSLIQSKYRPVILMGSTHDMRAEILRAIRPGELACLRCYNAPPSGIPDETLRERMAELSPTDLLRLAAEAKVGASDAKEYVATGKCGEAGDALLQVLRVASQADTRRFAIGFTSVASGTLLAAETVKLGLPDAKGLSLVHNRASLQFLRPHKNVVNSIRPRQSTCPACADGAALHIWMKRYTSHPYNQTLREAQSL